MGYRQWAHAHEDIINLVRFVSQDGYTALIMASSKGNPEVVKTLLAAGADKDAHVNVSS